MLAVLRFESRYLGQMWLVVPVMIFYGLAPYLALGAIGSIGLALLGVPAMSSIIRVFSPYDSGVDRNALLGTLPVARRQIISARYVLSLAIVALIFVLVMLIFDGGLPEKLGVASAFSALLLVSLVVVGPLSSKGGLGRWAATAPLGLVGIVVLAVAFLPATRRDSVVAVVQEAPASSALVGLVAAVVLTLGSCLLSIRWYERRDL